MILTLMRQGNSILSTITAGTGIHGDLRVVCECEDEKHERSARCVLPGRAPAGCRTRWWKDMNRHGGEYAEDRGWKPGGVTSDRLTMFNRAGHLEKRSRGWKCWVDVMHVWGGARVHGGSWKEIYDSTRKRRQHWYTPGSPERSSCSARKCDSSRGQSMESDNDA
jgi:hypothetical protein